MNHIKSINTFLDKRVVLTGGPGTGKSSICDRLESLGYKVVEEPARILLKKFKIESPENLPWNSINARNFFQASVEKMSVNNYLNNKSGIFDRSLVDEIGFRTHYNMEISTNLKDLCKKYRYDKIFIFPPWEKIFKNDEIRIETFEQCESINSHLLKGYRLMGYDPIEVPTTNIDHRLEFILDQI